MKYSGIKWIGDIPKEWKTMPHKYIMSKKKDVLEHYQGQDIISLTMNGVIVRDLDAGGKMPLSFDGYQLVYPNNLLLCLFDIDVTPRCVGLIKNYGVTSPAYSQFVMKKHGHSPYYDYLLRYIDDNKCFLHLSKNLRSSLTETDFGQIYTCVPPIYEQQKIADYLDTVCGEIDEMIALQEKMIEELKAYKQSVITEAVTKGLNPNVPMRDSGIDWIGDIPQHWQACRIKNKVIFNPGNIAPSNNIEVSYMPMECLRFNEIEKRTALYEDVKGYTPFAEGDIVMAKVTPCFENGNLAIAKGMTNGIGFGTSEIFVLRCNSTDCDSRYIFYYLRTPYILSRGVSSMVGTGGLKRVNPQFFLCSHLLLPPLSEQRAIADYLDAKCANIDRLITLKQEKIDSLKEYKKSLIYEYVTGKKQVN